MICVNQAQLTFLLISVSVLLGYSQQIETNVCNGTCQCKSRSTHIECDNHNFSSIPKGIPKQVESLYLGENKICNIEEKSLQGFPNLRSLYLEGNEITNLKEGTFKDLISLKFLELQHNKITRIEEGSFKNLLNLTELYLHDNSITNIKKGTFVGLPNLNKLNLDTNNISNIEDGAWRHLPNLTELNLNYNKHLNIEGTFNYLHNLDKLHLSGINLEDFGNHTWEHLQNLKELDLGVNEIKDIGEVFPKNLLKLQILKLYRNKIKHIKQEDFISLQKLKQLNLDNNEITNIGNETFKNLQNLEKLYMADNKISHIEEGVFKDLQSLTILNLNNNEITNIGNETFKNLQKLEKLYMADNKILHIEEWAFKDLQSLTILRLAGNNLTSIPSTMFQPLPSLKILNLRDNQIRKYEDEAFSSLLNITKIDLTGNKDMICGCHLPYFIKDINTTYDRHVNVQGHCHDNNQMKTHMEKPSQCKDWLNSFVLYLLHTRKSKKFSEYETSKKIEVVEHEISNTIGSFKVTYCGLPSKIVVFIIHCQLPKKITKKQVMQKLLPILSSSQALQELGLQRDNIKLTDEMLCKADTTESDEGTFHWPVTEIGTTEISCLENKATRKCISGTQSHRDIQCPESPEHKPFTGVWTEPDMSHCNNSGWITRELKKIKGQNINKHNLEYINKQLSSISKKSIYFKEIDVVLVTDIYKKIMQFMLNDSSNKKNDILLSIDNLINTPEKTLVEAEQQNRSVSRLLGFMETLLEKFPLEEQQSKVMYSKFGIGVAKIEKNSFNGFFYGVVPATDKTEAKSVIYNSLYPYPEPDDMAMMDYISLPKSLLTHLNEQKRSLISKITFYSMTNDKLYRVIQNYSDGSEYSIKSQIIAANIPNTQITNLDRPVIISFSLLHKNDSNLRCVYWDDTSKQNPHWSTKGCTINEIIPGKRINCSCDHLTSFALLTGIYPKHEKTKTDKPLYIICYIGCGISLAFLMLTLIIHTAFKNLWKKIASRILVNLCCSLGITHLILIVGMHPYSGRSTTICKFVAILLHYFLLASAMWITVEAIHIYRTVMAAFREYQKYFMIKSSLFAWGVPAIVIILILLLNKTNDYIGIKGVCWLSGTIFYVFFLIPVVAIFILNFIIFCLIVWRLISAKDGNNCEHETRKLRLFGIIFVLLLFGISWALAYFTFIEAVPQFIYICATFHALQGLFIFIFYCIYKKDARNIVCVNLCKRKKYTLQKSCDKNNTDEGALMMK